MIPSILGREDLGNATVGLVVVVLTGDEHVPKRKRDIVTMLPSPIVWEVVIRIVADGLGTLLIVMVVITNVI